MKIGIIGSGHIGGTLTRRLTDLGHDVSVANSRGPETLRDLAQETGAHASTVNEAVRGKDLVIVAIPEKAVRDLPKDLFADVPRDTIVVETGNYYPERDGRITDIEEGTPESVWVQNHFKHPIIKAFNNIRWDHLLKRGKPAGTPGRIALPVSGDDSRQKQVVMRLMDDLGFDAVDAGPLSESWRQQPGSPVYIADRDRSGVERGLSEASPDRPPQFRSRGRQAAD